MSDTLHGLKPVALLHSLNPGGKTERRKTSPAPHRPGTQCRAMNSRAAVCPASNGATST
jgi:hypothetical protein